MKSRQDYERALEVVGEFVAKWDPMSLLAGGAPKDEYEAEVARLVTYIPHISSPGSAARAISEVFSREFQPEGFSQADCAEPGTRLYEALSSASLVGGD